MRNSLATLLLLATSQLSATTIADGPVSMQIGLSDTRENAYEVQVDVEQGYGSIIALYFHMGDEDAINDRWRILDSSAPMHLHAGPANELRRIDEGSELYGSLYFDMGVRFLDNPQYSYYFTLQNTSNALGSAGLVQAGSEAIAVRLDNATIVLGSGIVGIDAPGAWWMFYALVLILVLYFFIPAFVSRQGDDK